jgi:hypothetical protein
VGRHFTGNRLHNVPVSNVGGPRERGHIAGTVMSQFFSAGPLTAGSYPDSFECQTSVRDSNGRVLLTTHASEQRTLTAFVVKGAPCNWRRAAGCGACLRRLGVAAFQMHCA